LVTKLVRRLRASNRASARPALWSPPGLNPEVVRFLAYNGLIYIGLLGITDVVLNFYFVSLGYTSENIGMLQSIPRLGGFLTSLPVGLLANRAGTRRVVFYSTIGIAITYLMLIVWTSLIGLSISRFLIGIFYGAIQIATTPLLIHLSSPQHETHVFAYLNVVSMGTTALGSVIGGFLPWAAVRLTLASSEQAPQAYRFALTVAGVLIIGSSLLLLHLRDPQTGMVHLPRVAGRADVPWRKLVWLSSPLLLFGFTGGLTFPFYNLFFRATYAASDQTVGAILSLGWVGMALVPLANPWWEMRYGRVWAISIAMTIAAAAFLGLSLAPVLATGVVCYVVAISFRNMMQPLFQPLIMGTLPSEYHNLISSIGMVLWNIGWFAATAISGVWQADYGFDFIMQVVAAGVFLNGVLIVWVFRRAASPSPHV
jgi:MFS family permease